MLQSNDIGCTRSKPPLITMKRQLLTLSSLTLIAASVVPAAWAQTLDPYEFKVARQGDLELNCAALVNEAQLMNQIIKTTEDLKNDAKVNNQAITAAGALGSFLVTGLTGGLGIAAVGFFASQEFEEGENQAESVQDVAHQRRALMNGIFQAKGCENPVLMEEAMTPIKSKTTLEATAERFASIETAAGDKPSHYNE